MQIQTDKKNHTLFLHRRKDLLLEALFHCFWDTLEPDTVLHTSDQESVHILFPGTWNRGKEPDFTGARILFQGKELQGDVVLHEKVSDYVTLGHLTESCYDNVILHIFTDDDRPGEKFVRKDGPLGHLICCQIPRQILLRRKESVNKCRFFPCMSQEKIREFFLEAGQERLQQKSLVILEEMISAGTEAAFCKSLLLAAGNKYNKDAFAELYTRIREYDIALFRAHYKALLWGESSLLEDPAKESLPEENRKEARLLWDEFWTYRKTAREKICYQTGRIRPYNFPERRIAMICAFLDRFGLTALETFARDLKKLGPANFVKTMKKKLLLSDPFWDLHCNFHTKAMSKKASILGQTQAQTLLTDAIAPALLAYAKLINDEILERASGSLTCFLPPNKNFPVFDRFLKQWFPEREEETAALFDNACLTQGVLYMAGEFCSGCSGTGINCPPAEL